KIDLLPAAARHHFVAHRAASVFVPDEYGDEHGVEYAYKGDAAAETALHDVECAHADIELLPGKLIDDGDNADRGVQRDENIENFETESAEEIRADEFAHQRRPPTRLMK